MNCDNDCSCQPPSSHLLSQDRVQFHPGNHLPHHLNCCSDSIKSSDVIDAMDGLSKLNELKIGDGDSLSEIQYCSYESELQMSDIMRLIQKDLSEPYSIYTYRYFIYNWPQLCFLVSFPAASSSTHHL